MPEPTVISLVRKTTGAIRGLDEAPEIRLRVFIHVSMLLIIHWALCYLLHKHVHTSINL